MRLLEGPVYNNVDDILQNDFSVDGFCTYLNTYMIVSIDFYTKNGSSKYRLMKHLSDKAEEDGFTFPDVVDTNASWFLCTGRGTPYNKTRSVGDPAEDYKDCYFDSLEDLVKALRVKVNESDTLGIKIKEAFSRKTATKWDPETQPNLYALGEFLRKAGYRLVDVLEHNDVLELLIEPKEEGYLHPNITHNLDTDEFTVDVRKYGELGASDLEEIIKGYEASLGVIKYLNSLHLNTLEVEREEEEEEPTPDEK